MKNLFINKKLELLKNSIENGNKLPINFERPIGIRNNDNDKRYLDQFKEKERIEKEKRFLEISKELDKSFNEKMINPEIHSDISKNGWRQEKNNRERKLIDEMNKINKELK